MPASISRLSAALALAACTTAVAACSGEGLSRSLGLIHDAPDEFTVTTRAPLAMPTNFALPPPTPGVPRPQEQSERAKAELALVPQMALGAQPPDSSPGQQALVQSAGPPAAPEIRAAVDQEARASRPSPGIGDKLMFWRTPPKPGIVVDPDKEARRLRENSALGQTQETGDTPIVQPKSRAWLEGIF